MLMLARKADCVISQIIGLRNRLLKIFKRNPKHTKAFPFFFVYIFMMYFVSPSNSSGIFVIRVSKKFKPLMNKNIMDYKVG